MYNRPGIELYMMRYTHNHQMYLQINVTALVKMFVQSQYATPAVVKLRDKIEYTNL